MNYEGPLVYIGAHPDDDATTCGGLLAEAALAGFKVICIFMTRGEMGTGCAPEGADVAALRGNEQQTAAAHLGIANCIYLDFTDDGGENWPYEEGVRQLITILKSVGARTVISFDDGGVTGHPAHVRAGAMALDAFSRADLYSARLLQVVTTREFHDSTRPYLSSLGAMIDESRPRIIPDEHLAMRRVVSGPMLRRKLAAVLSHESQGFHNFSREHLLRWLALEAYIEVG